MAIYRVIKNSDYTTISNYHLRDANLSLKAKGLLTLMLSLPDSWEYSENGLISICKEGEASVKTALKELKAFRYLIVFKKKPNETESGRIEYEYNVYEQPQRIQGVEKQGVENPPQLNTNILSTNILNTDINKKEIFNKEKRFKKPTVEEIQEYINSKGYDLDAEHIYNHYETSDWYRGNTKIKDWRAAVRTWNKNKDRFASNNKKKETKYNYDNSEDFTDEF